MKRRHPDPVCVEPGPSVRFCANRSLCSRLSPGGSGREGYHEKCLDTIMESKPAGLEEALRHDQASAARRCYIYYVVCTATGDSYGHSPPGRRRLALRTPGRLAQHHRLRSAPACELGTSLDQSAGRVAMPVRVADSASGCRLLGPVRVRMGGRRARIWLYFYSEFASSITSGEDFSWFLLGKEVRAL